MSPFDVTILGSNSAVPTPNRHSTSQLLNINNHYYLIDCGEATQIQMRRYGIKFQRIEHIFISHLHGDHYFGLIGLLNTMHLLGREKALTIHANRMLKEIINLQLSVANSKLKFTIHYNFLDSESDTEILVDKNVRVTATPLEHRIPCFGFVFEETVKAVSIDKSYIADLKLSIKEILLLKQGESVKRNNQIIKTSDVAVKQSPPRKYAFISDTKPSKKYLKCIENSQLIYHEATFMHNEEKRANDTFHTTTIQAAEIAKETECKQLIIGHFSSRYNDLELLLAETKTVFENTLLAIEGSTYTVNH